MENPSRLYKAIVALLRSSKQWADLRHLYTLVWMVIGLIHSGAREFDQVGDVYPVTG